MNEAANNTELKLPRTLDLAAAEGLLETIRSRLAHDPRLCVDASAVELITLPCMQIILSALRTYGQMSVMRPSEEYINAFQDLGMIAASSRRSTLTWRCPPMLQPIPIVSANGESPMSKRVLTIDDSKTIRDMLMLTLAEAGFEVLQAVDGLDGLDVLDKEQVDVVITDINMPRMDGYEVIRHLRGNSAHKSTPILVLTTESEADKKNLARVAGATGWMVKPFDPERLIATINKVAP